MESDDSMDTILTSDSAGIVLTQSIIKEKIAQTEFSIGNKKGRSNVWKTFGSILDKNGVELEHLVVCKKCLNIYKYNQKCTSNLVRHKCYLTEKSAVRNIPIIDVSSDEKKKITELCTQWAVENCRSLRIVEDSGFLELTEYLIYIGSKYGANVDINNLLPHPTTISRNVNKLYSICRTKIFEEISEVKTNGFSLTSDIWTDNYERKSYLSVTIHFVKEGKLINRLLGLKSMKGEKCTGANIEAKALGLLHDFGCSFNEKATMVTDRGTNMVAAFRNYKHIFCINHLLDNVLQKSLLSVSEVDTLCNAATKLVKFFKKSGHDSSLHTSLKSFCPTRWNTIYYLLESIKNNWSEIVKILQETSQINRLNNIKLNQISEIVKLLKPFEEASRELEGEYYPTIHLSYIHINNLIKSFNINEEDTNIVRKLKEKLKYFFDIIVLENITIYHKIALFLFPPTNKLIYFNEDEKNIIICECKKLMKLFDHSSDEGECYNSPAIATKKSKLFSDFLIKVDIQNTEDIIGKELIRYQKVNVAYYDDFDCLQWWYLHQKEFPLLYKVSCKILSIPATSAPSERIFSKARNLISEKSSAISSNSIAVKEIMFLNINICIDKGNLIGLINDL